MPRRTIISIHREKVNEMKAGAPNRTWAWEIYGPPKKKVLCE